MSFKVVGVVLLVTSFLCPAWGVLEDGVELCYSFRPQSPGMEDLSVKWNLSWVYEVTVERIETETDRYAQVTLRALMEDRPFQGFMLRAVNTPTGRPKPLELEPLPIGAFHPAPECQLLSCFRGLDNAVVHYDSGMKSEAVVNWSPPMYRGTTPGSVIFVATVIENSKKYWYGVASAPIVI